MRVAFVTETWQPSLDGVVVRLTHTVEDLARRGHPVLVVAPTTGDPVPGVTQVRTGGGVVPLIDRRRQWARPDRRVVREVTAFGPDLVHVVSPVLMGTWAVRQLAGRVPVVASLHTDLAAYASRYHLGATRPVLRALNRAAYRQADLALATSPTGLRLLRDLGVRRPRIWSPAVERMFTDPPEPSAAGRSIASRAGRDLEVLCVGRLAREKHYDLLAPLMSAPVGRGMHLTMVGDGPDRARLERVFAGTSTTFVGTLRGRALVDAYRDADVVAFTSPTETVGLVLLEAAALARPVVCVDTPATRDTLDGYPRVRFVSADAPPPHWRAALSDAVGSPEPVGDETVVWAPLSWEQATDELLAGYATVAASGR